MEFEPQSQHERIGWLFGYLLAYAAFTSVLFFSLGFLGKLPSDWGAAHVAGITAVVALAGMWLKRVL